MGKRFNAGVVPDKQGDLFPNGLFHVKVAELKEGDHEGQLLYDLRAEICKPQKFEGQSWFTRLFIGTPDDPEADEEDTQRKSFGLRLIKRICAVTGVDFDQDMDVVCEELKDQEFIARNRQRHKDGEDFNSMRWAFGLDEAQPEVYEDGESKPKGKPATARRTTNGSGKPAATAKASRKPAPQPAASDGEFELEEVEE